MAWKIEKVVCGVLTRQMAQKYMDMPAIPNDRPLKPWHLDELEDEFKHNRLRLASFASVYVKEDKTTYRVNGKHTATLFSKMNGEFPSKFPAIEEFAVADTLRDGADLYSTYDPKTSSRSQSDINAAFAGSDPDLREMSRKTINLAVTSIAFANWEGYYSEHKAVDRAALCCTEHKPFVRWLAKLTEGSNEYRFLRRGSVGAAMYKTFHKSQKAATDFWTQVRDASNPDPNNATRKLNKYLLTTVIASQRALRVGVNTDTLHAMYVRCLHAWNAWRDDEPTSLRYYPDKPTPSVR